ncbi:ABC transporter permease [Natronolimnobius sp. AArcel1]|uniref:ABC transporter permease n=1 Tax=Natronolimnobius sp. AArcel1 TaxID=1679093 RepID=UPI0013EC02D9|nr:ABC transporter permease [Natronolimnobius sp. AArcel1]NGM67936.1 ABC transporter permease [Natronolimnobius sp. AArcel1]
MKWFIKRTGQALFTLWAVATLSFGLIRLMPGGAADMMATQIQQNSPGTNIPREQLREQIAAQLQVDPDAPIHEAYYQYMSSLAQGDFGYSIRYDEQVNTLIADVLPWTLFLMALATLGMFALALSLGAIMAYKEGSYFDLANTGVGIFLSSVPYYVAAVVFIALLGYRTPLFPTGERYPSGVDPGLSFEFIFGALHHAMLPALSFIITGYGLLALTMRGNSIQTLGEDYVRVAQLRGLSDRRIALRYVGRNAVLPLYTSLLISIGFMFGGSIILEILFNYRGIGFIMEQGIIYRDMPLMMGTFLVITFGVVIAIWIGDATYGKLDPRIKSGDEGEAY